MKKIKVLNNAVTLTSDMALRDIQTLQQYAPQALKVIEKNNQDEDIEVFAVSATVGNASINEYGINFTQETAGNHATVTALFPDYFETEEEKNQFLKDHIFEISKNLVIVEKQAKKALETLDKELKTFSENVEFINVDE